MFYSGDWTEWSVGLPMRSSVEQHALLWFSARFCSQSSTKIELWPQNIQNPTSTGGPGRVQVILL